MLYDTLKLFQKQKVFCLYYLKWIQQKAYKPGRLKVLNFESFLYRICKESRCEQCHWARQCRVNRRISDQQINYLPAVARQWLWFMLTDVPWAVTSLKKKIIDRVKNLSKSNMRSVDWKNKYFKILAKIITRTVKHCPQTNVLNLRKQENSTCYRCFIFSHFIITCQL